MSIHDAVMRRVPVSTYGSVSLNVRLGPVSGPPLLLLHGHPQTHLMWRKVWSELSPRFTLVAPDLRGYGDSDKPAGAPDHANYSKRVMASDCVELMHSLGYDTFMVAAHDRGARVAHRLAADHPQRVSALALLDIAPTLAMYEQTSDAFARAYWHWFFLIQPHPLPETLLASKGPDYVRCMLGGRHAGLAPFEPEVLAEYQRCASDPATLHGFCEDYRASAGIDLEHDRADRAAGRRLALPLHVLWGAQGVVGRLFDPLALWREVADDVSGQALDCKHFLAEEKPAETLAALAAFLGRQPAP